MADVQSDRKGKVARPLSPHLQIYRPPVNMVMSILHRITGVALYVGTLLLLWWCFGLASGPKYFAYVNSWLLSPLGKLILVGFTWALFHHLLGGLRHLLWDTGRGLDLKSVNTLSWLTIVGSILLTVLFWLFVVSVRGGF